MLKLLILSFLSCFTQKALTESEGATAAEQTSETPIYWDECSYRSGEHICNLSLPNSSGEYISLYDYYDRPIVIQLSAEWCYYCHIGGTFAEEFMDSWAGEDLLWIAILLENDERVSPTQQDLLEWEEEMETENSIVLQGSRDLIDAAADHGFPLTSWPYFVIVDRDMVIYSSMAGWSEGMLNQQIASMIFNSE